MLNNQIALITGAGSGIGQAGAIALAREGATLIVTDINLELAEHTVALIREQGGTAYARALDATDDTAIQSLMADIIRHHGRIDIVHSHAGIQVEGTLEQVSAQQMDDSWALNVRSHFVLAQAAVPHMREQGGGSIIITSSNSGAQYDREMIAYCTTKHAVIAMTKQMAADYAKYNVRFNALCPGFVDTPFNAGFEQQMGGREQLEAYISSEIPMGRWASTEEIAEGIVYLASPRSSFMTGQALVIDGGEVL
ncbi:SDR family NAD(P)-dependent oxidoreductase [Neptuniibacter halophilus]|uniref:SDR family NAD(P)-dependent oxidoreductase n=1 Tax=Neptuniibacter halophilus TaxID=651666 RepID=UPI002573C966|nr:SDR family oxidoreductase [Neptuniibacter halophilus]